MGWRVQRTCRKVIIVYIAWFQVKCVQFVVRVLTLCQNFSCCRVWTAFCETARYIWLCVHGSRTSATVGNASDMTKFCTWQMHTKWNAFLSGQLKQPMMIVLRCVLWYSYRRPTLTIRKRSPGRTSKWLAVVQRVFLPYAKILRRNVNRKSNRCGIVPNLYSKHRIQQLFADNGSERPVFLFDWFAIFQANVLANWRFADLSDWQRSITFSMVVVRHQFKVFHILVVGNDASLCYGSCMRSKTSWCFILTARRGFPFRRRPLLRGNAFGRGMRSNWSVTRLYIDDSARCRRCIVRKIVWLQLLTGVCCAPCDDFHCLIDRKSPCTMCSYWRVSK